MAKVAEDAAEELLLNDERIETPRKLNRHVVVAINHMTKRRLILIDQTDKLNREIEDLDEALAALR